MDFLFTNPTVVHERSPGSPFWGEVDFHKDFVNFETERLEEAYTFEPSQR
jgi:hypothetical protein